MADVAFLGKPDVDGVLILPVIPLREGVIYPDVITPVSLTSPQALAALEAAQQQNTGVIAVAQRDPLLAVASPADLYNVGTESVPEPMLRILDDAKSVLMHGGRRVEIIEYVQQTPYLIAKARLRPDVGAITAETRSLAQAAINLFKRAAELNATIPEDVLVYFSNMDEPGQLADQIAATLTLSLSERQKVLEMVDVNARLGHVAILLGKELSMLQLKDDISLQVQQEMDRSQREIYLREQIRVIQTELGEEDFAQQEISEVREQIIKAALPAEINEKALRELGRLMIMPPMAPEVGIIRTYIDWLTGIPWSKSSRDNLEITHAQRILDADHYGLPKVKDRILEYIAVHKLAPDKHRSPILCFVGPPGVGKTSLGKSIARALGREFVRVSLGGVRDEAEIRGHRRTYIGAMPGRIIQTMKRAKTLNPVFVLDEIDKLGEDFRGDPAAALLEVLDPEQNFAFSDHYLDVPYDLSKVMFITTANDLDPLPDALLDRLEVIEFPGYTEEEKVAIARRFLLPHQLEAHGLDKLNLQFETRALHQMIREYTYEAGVRSLDRTIATVCRKIARLAAEGKSYPKRITANRLDQFLGAPEFMAIRPNAEDSIGLATGIAWTSSGGDIMTIEVSVLPGKGTLLMTGSLGDVMQESAQAALSYMRSRATEFDVPHDDFENFDVHIHVPEGAVPKEGPSAGVTLAVAIISAFTERKVRSDYAMTGEITLRGKVLPVGGIKEKVLAARRANILNVILPGYNKRELSDIPEALRKDMKIIFVDDLREVIDLVLLEAPPEGRKRDLERSDDEKDEKDDKE